MQSRELRELVGYIDYDTPEQGKILQETLEVENLPFFIVNGKLGACRGVSSYINRSQSN